MTTSYSNMARHMKRHHPVVPGGQDGGASSSSSCTTSRDQSPAPATEPRSLSNMSQDDMNKLIQDAVLCMMRKPDDNSMVSLKSYLASRFPMIPVQFREPIIVASFTAAWKASVTHLDAILEQADARTIYAKKALARWSHCLSAIEPPPNVYLSQVPTAPTDEYEYSPGASLRSNEIVTDSQHQQVPGVVPLGTIQLEQQQVPGVVPLGAVQLEQQQVPGVVLLGTIQPGQQRVPGMIPFGTIGPQQQSDPAVTSPVGVDLQHQQALDFFHRTTEDLIASMNAGLVPAASSEFPASVAGHAVVSPIRTINLQDMDDMGLFQGSATSVDTRPAATPPVQVTIAPVATGDVPIQPPDIPQTVPEGSIVPAPMEEGEMSTPPTARNAASSMPETFTHMLALHDDNPLLLEELSRPLIDDPITPIITPEKQTDHQASTQVLSESVLLDPVPGRESSKERINNKPSVASKVVSAPRIKGNKENKSTHRQTSPRNAKKPKSDDLNIAQRNREEELLQDRHPLDTRFKIPRRPARFDHRRSPPVPRRIVHAEPRRNDGYRGRGSFPQRRGPLFPRQPSPPAFSREQLEWLERFPFPWSSQFR